jgi:hypothetical protein
VLGAGVDADDTIAVEDQNAIEPAGKGGSGGRVFAALALDPALDLADGDHA